MRARLGKPPARVDATRPQLVCCIGPQGWHRRRRPLVVVSSRLELSGACLIGTRYYRALPCLDLSNFYHFILLACGVSDLCAEGIQASGCVYWSALDVRFIHSTHKALRTTPRISQWCKRIYIPRLGREDLSGSEQSSKHSSHRCGVLIPPPNFLQSRQDRGVAPLTRKSCLLALLLLRLVLHVPSKTPWRPVCTPAFRLACCECDWRSASFHRWTRSLLDR